MGGGGGGGGRGIPLEGDRESFSRHVGVPVEQISVLFSGRSKGAILADNSYIQIVGGEVKRFPPVTQMTTEQLRGLPKNVGDAFVNRLSAQLALGKFENGLEDHGLVVRDWVNGDRVYRTYTDPENPDKSFLRIGDQVLARSVFDRGPAGTDDLSATTAIAFIQDVAAIEKAMTDPERHVAPVETRPIGLLDYLEFFRRRYPDSPSDFLQISWGDGEVQLLTRDHRYVDTTKSLLPTTPLEEMSREEIALMPDDVVLRVAGDIESTLWSQLLKTVGAHPEIDARKARIEIFDLDHKGDERVYSWRGNRAMTVRDSGKRGRVLKTDRSSDKPLSTTRRALLERFITDSPVIRAQVQSLGAGSPLVGRVLAA